MRPNPDAEKMTTDRSAEGGDRLSPDTEPGSSSTPWSRRAGLIKKGEGRTKACGVRDPNVGRNISALDRDFSACNSGFFIAIHFIVLNTGGARWQRAVLQTVGLARRALSHGQTIDRCGDAVNCCRNWRCKSGKQPSPDAKLQDHLQLPAGDPVGPAILGRLIAAAHRPDARAVVRRAHAGWRHSVTVGQSSIERRRMEA